MPKRQRPDEPRRDSETSDVRSEAPRSFGAYLRAAADVARRVRRHVPDTIETMTLGRVFEEE